jgi:hypothetical protein
MSYDFSNSADKAFGNNLKLMSGKYIVYGGDINQDGIVDANDMISADNDASAFLQGYLSSDVNGNGSVNSNDFPIIETNTSAFVSKKMP